MLQKTMVDEKPDLVHREWTNLAPFLEYVHGAAIVIGSHNVESDIWKRLAANASNPLMRLLGHQQARRIERLEREWYPRVDHCIAVSPEDAAVIAGYGACVSVVENGVDLGYYDLVEQDPDDKCISFVASFDVFTNQDAAHFLIQKVLPGIKKEHPGVTCCLVGKSPPEAIRAYHRPQEGIIVTGSVPDVRPFIRKSCVCVVPLRIGGGTKLKVLEAMAMRKPVVSTSVGAEGLAVTDGTNILLADTPEAFARKVCWLLDRPVEQKRVGLAGWQLVASRYDWEPLARKQDLVWRNAARVP